MPTMALRDVLLPLLRRDVLSALVRPPWLSHALQISIIRPIGEGKGPAAADWVSWESDAPPPPSPLPTPPPPRRAPPP